MEQYLVTFQCFVLATSSREAHEIAQQQIVDDEPNLYSVTQTTNGNEGGWIFHGEGGVADA